MAAKRNRTVERASKRILVLDFGRYEITGETDKYWLCGWTQFRKTNKHILRIEDVVDVPFEDAEGDPSVDLGDGQDEETCGPEEEEA